MTKVIGDRATALHIGSERRRLANIEVSEEPFMPLADPDGRSIEPTPAAFITFTPKGKVSGSNSCLTYVSMSPEVAVEVGMALTEAGSRLLASRIDNEAVVSLVRRFA